ncbi:MAG: hypothetical protein J7647_03945 [Cyanobacteria bacterium SBLK]|nr:hypothetical protein [Cyanobacteria bacterium SBLK]
MEIAQSFAGFGTIAIAMASKSAGKILSNYIFKVMRSRTGKKRSRSNSNSLIK